MRFLILRRLYPLFAASADANIFISTDGLKTFYRVVKPNMEKSKVIYHGRDELFRPVRPDIAADFVRTEYCIIRERGAKVGKLALAGDNGGTILLS